MSKEDNMQRINLQTGSVRMESPENLAPTDEESQQYLSEIDETQRRLEELRKRKAEQEVEEARLRAIQVQKDELCSHRNEVLELLTDALTGIDGQLEISKREINDLEQAKQHFYTSLQKIESVDPGQWGDADLEAQSQKLTEYLSKISGEYDQFLVYMEELRTRSFEGAVPKRKGAASQFGRDMLRGFAFSLPLIVALTALFLYFLVR